jgi:hypothetical protein
MDDATTVELDQPITSLPLQDVLRTIGYGLEASRVRRARLQLNAVGIVVETTGAYAVRSYTWDDLAVQVRIQRGLRQPSAPATDPWTLTRWSVLLRATGLLLDAHVVFTAAAIHERLEWLRLRHAADRSQPPAPAGTRRRWRPSWPHR